MHKETSIRKFQVGLKITQGFSKASQILKPWKLMIILANPILSFTPENDGGKGQKRNHYLLEISIKHFSHIEMSIFSLSIFALYWPAKQQTSLFYRPWWFSVSPWRICIFFVWPRSSLRLTEPSIRSERHLHFASIRLCLALLFIISIQEY